MENKQERLRYKFGLIGKNIDYSFSRTYFNRKFELEELPYSYENFDLEHISELSKVLSNTSQLKGLNVTIPYKESIIPFLDGIDKQARAIGAVNTVKISKNAQLIGYNTDFIGFQESLKPYLSPSHNNALILGTGGASKGIAFALNRLGISYDFVSRSNSSQVKFNYSDLTTAIISSYPIIINCTPLGTYPNVNSCPDIPYEGIGPGHICYDLIYNPEQTKFLSCADLQGAQTLNGLEMLHIQADAAWNIWMKESV